MARDSHKAWLTFIRKAVDLTASYSVEDLWNFRNLAMTESPMLVRLINAYVELAEKSEVDVLPPDSRSKRSRNGGRAHLFDLLREKEFFPQNVDLAEFAARVLPHMRPFSFNKMSRADIAGRIIEYLEAQRDPRAREKLESSMREALGEMKRRSVTSSNRRSFLSKWERIIKGLEL